MKIEAKSAELAWTGVESQNNMSERKGRCNGQLGGTATQGPRIKSKTKQGAYRVEGKEGRPHSLQVRLPTAFIMTRERSQ